MKYAKEEVLGKYYPQLLILALAMFLFIVCSLIGICLIQASGQKHKGAEPNSPPKSYTSIEIQPGDSLWSIASEHITEEYQSIQDYVKEIKALNGLGDDNIHAGKFLIVPYYP
ncbi:MAG: LysM peptidoglycan-binding domain-containing protein [Lachnospiraceae bacterium]|nr:LysM peptidoglycan-binding domain-containing protein [Lachnospiraceae bacterium]